MEFPYLSLFCFPIPPFIHLHLSLLLTCRDELPGWAGAPGFAALQIMRRHSQKVFLHRAELSCLFLTMHVKLPSSGANELVCSSFCLMGAVVQTRDEAGTEQPGLGSQYGAADAGGCAGRLDSVCSSALSAIKLGSGWARPKQRGAGWDEGKMINRDIPSSSSCMFWSVWLSGSALV